MAFSLEYKPGVRAYLRGLNSLSRQGRNRLFALIDFDLRQHGDAPLADANHCLDAEKAIFQYEPTFLDQDGDGLIHHFRIAVDASPAAVGVLRIIYVEESSR